MTASFGTARLIGAYRASPGRSQALSGTAHAFLECVRERAKRWRFAVATSERRILRCAIYTRKSSEHGLEQNFNSLDAQRESAEAYIKSQAHEGWRLIPT